METQPVERCPVCGTAERAVLHAGLTDRVFGVAPGEWTLLRCSGCGSAYLDPRPTDAALPEAYADYYTHAAPAIEPAPSGVPATLRRALRNGYVNRRYGYRLTPSSALGPLAFGLLRAQRAHADRAFRHLGPQRLLDAGCGDGTFVAHAQAAGAQATGIDVDERAVAAARAAGLDVRPQPLEELAGSAFDALTMSHVIEHVAQPLDFLRAARAALRPGGTLWVATPNLDAAGHRRYGRDWLHLDPPRHLVLFTAGSLRGAIEAAGFHDVRCAPSAVPEARTIFGLSEEIRHGDGARSGVGATLAAAASDLRSRFSAGAAEELVLLATA